MTAAVLWALVLLAVWFAGAWGLFAAFNSLHMREVPGAVLALMAGGETRRRLRRIIERRRAAARQQGLPSYAGPDFAAELARVAKAYPVLSFPVASPEVLQQARMRLRRPGEVFPLVLPDEPTRLVLSGEPACDDPSCAGCQALRARRRHEAAR